MVYVGKGYGEKRKLSPWDLNRNQFAILTLFEERKLDFPIEQVLFKQQGSRRK
jgi:hypothetical protein